MISPAHSRLLPALAVTLLYAGACVDEPRPFELRYQTKHLRIGTDFDYPLCAGDLAAIERQVDDLEAQLSTQLPGPIEVYLWETADFPADEFCGTTLDAGCYDPTAHIIYSSLYALDHELVHAVVDSLGTRPGFFNEGAAEALGRRRTFFGPTPPAVNIDLQGPAIDYQTAGHFARWLWESGGSDAFVALLSDPRAPAAAFEGIYGQSIEVAQDSYFAEAPYSYAPLRTCEHPALPEIDTASWAETLQLRCEAEDTYGRSQGLLTYRTVEIGERRDYAITTDASAASIARCQDEHLLAMPVDDDPDLGDVPTTTSASPEQFVHVLFGQGAVNVLDLAPGRYEIAVQATAPGPIALSVSGL